MVGLNVGGVLVDLNVGGVHVGLIIGGTHVGLNVGGVHVGLIVGGVLVGLNVGGVHVGLIVGGVLVGLNLGGAHVGLNACVICDVLNRRENFCVCDVPLIFGKLCRMNDFYVGNEYIFIDRRLSKYCPPVKNYGFSL
jgi:hypothetical protein